MAASACLASSGSPWMPPTNSCTRTVHPAAAMSRFAEGGGVAGVLICTVLQGASEQAQVHGLHPSGASGRHLGMHRCKGVHPGASERAQMYESTSGRKCWMLLTVHSFIEW